MTASRATSRNSATATSPLDPPRSDGDLRHDAVPATRHSPQLPDTSRGSPKAASLPERKVKLDETQREGTSASLPTYTFNEILADYKNWDFKKLHLASHLAYPPEKPYVLDLEQLVGEIATRMIKTVPAEMQKVSPEDLLVRLVDRPSVNAYVITSKSGAFEVFINRGLIEEFLVAPEFKEGDLCIDAFAAIVAHEICHTNFKRTYNGAGNSMLQEEYCDLLPAKMLERVGLRPEAMSKLCDLFARISRDRGTRKISYDEPHASAPIRKEIYEKGAWHEYEKERRKIAIQGTERHIDSLRVT